jgi:hypothetical protein
MADVYELKPIAPENERFGNRKFKVPFTQIEWPV